MSAWRCKTGCCIPWGNGEGYIAYRLSGQKVGLKAVLPLAKAFLGAMGLKALIRFDRIMSKGGSGLDKQFDREKKPYIYVGLVCVREPYQGQGDMRKIMDAAFSEGNRLGVPVNLDTDTSARTSPSELRIKQSCVFLATSIPTQIMMIPPVCVYLILGSQDALL